MTLFGVSAATLLAWPLALALLGAGVVNGAGPARIRDDFLRWGYPPWWNLVTGALEGLAAALIAWPATRAAAVTALAALDLALVMG